MSVKYLIHRLSARAVLGYVREDGDRFSFYLDESATRRCFVYGNNEQEDNALFYQTMCVLRGGTFPSASGERIRTELSDVIFYMDFAGIFDRADPDRQKKAESLFRPEGVTLDFGIGPHSYLAFERSGSMSRQGRLSFIRADLRDEVRRRIMLDMTVGRCQLSKLYAYNGLMLSSGTRIDGIDIARPGRVVVVENEEFEVSSKIVTVEGETVREGVRRYRRVESESARPLKVTRFDGEGLISPEYAKLIDRKYCGRHIHHSFQVRLPFIKGMLHEVDFRNFLHSAGCGHVTDIWGVRHPIDAVEIILTRSMVKGLGWMEENHLSWNGYWERFTKYGHALYVTNTGKPKPERYTELNYQFLNTLSMTEEEFRPADLPLGWDYSPNIDVRRWITKATEQRYYDLCASPEYRLSVFTEGNDVRAKVLRKNPLFINEPVFTDQLDAMAKHTLKQYALGRLLVEGDNRFLSGDLLEFLAFLIDHAEALRNADSRQRTFYSAAMSTHFKPNSFYAPGAAYEPGDACTLLRNPHIARNEEIQLEPYGKAENMRKYYLGHLTDVVMVDAGMLAAERLGGADYDGDMVKTIADPVLNRCVRRNYELGHIDNWDNLPLLLIPSEEPVIRDANDWHDRFVTVRDTFSSRVGQICNAAFDRSVVAYDENSTAEERERYRQETETLAILVGLEIDAAKSGVRPDLDEYLKHKTVRRSGFLKYRTLLEDGNAEQRRKLIEATDWSAVSSNVEKLPYYAYMLREHTPRLKPKPAEDSELFTFAADPDWKNELDPKLLAAVDSLLRDYTTCLSRIRACKAPIKSRRRENDIRRVLYSRRQEDRFDVDELYAAFSALEPQRVADLRRELAERSWHFMSRDNRLDFLSELLPEFEEWFDLLTDFRVGGYRVLGDLICDIDDENTATKRKRLHRDMDSPAFTAMMDGYENKPYSQNYREAVAEVCRKVLTKIVKPRLAVRYVVALGKRNLLWDLLPEQIEKEARRWTPDDQ